MNHPMADAAGILLIWLLCLLSALLHEMGHAFGYWIAAKKTGWKIFVGSGPGIVATKKYVFRLIPAGGHFIPEQEPGTKKEIIATLSGGPLASLLLTVLFGVLRFSLFDSGQPLNGLDEVLFPVFNFLLCFNFFQFLSTVLPIRYEKCHIQKNIYGHRL